MVDQHELYLIQTENRHLKDTIIALREELERVSIQHEDNIQKAIAVANDGINQLQATVVAMRDELERNKIASEEEFQKIRRTACAEIEQLQHAIFVLRDKLEAYEKK